MIIEITLQDNSSRLVELRHFGAMEGWDIQRDYIEFAHSKDKEFRRAFTFRVLSFATIKLADRELPLSTDALIDNHLGTWPNIETVFRKVLAFNDIDFETHAEHEEYWTKVGAEVAVGFMAECSKLLSPALMATIANKE